MDDAAAARHRRFAITLGQGAEQLLRFDAGAKLSL
jgi:hypothetical protein